MEDYNFEQEGSFSMSDFENRIIEAKRLLSDFHHLDEEGFRQSRHSESMGISIGLNNAIAALVIEYEIIKDGKVIGVLEGHFSNKHDYMHVFSSRN